MHKMHSVAITCCLLAALAVSACAQAPVLKLERSGVKVSNQSLTEAVINRDLNAAALLLDAGIAVDERDPQTNKTPLMIAVENTDADMIKMLLDAGSEINTPDSSGLTPLLLACRIGSAETVELLLANGAALEVRDVNGLTPMVAALASGRKPVVEILLRAGVSPDGLTPGGNPLLVEAMQQGYLEVAPLLVMAGANPNAVGKDGLTPLMLAGRSGLIDIVQLLLENEKTDVQALGPLDPRQKGTAFEMAILCGRVDVVRVFLDTKCADANLNNAQGISPLMTAAKAGQVDVVNLLLSRGARVNYHDPVYGVTPLMMAVRGDQSISEDQKLAVLKVLLDVGADINGRDVNKGTALMNAVEKGHKKVVRYLLIRGAYAQAETRSGKSALSIARAKGMDDVADLLVQFGAQH
jgi:ankyrin repeat protein